VRRALTTVLLASGLKLLGISTGLVLATVGAALVCGVVVWAWIRTRMGEPPRAWQRRLRRSSDAVAAPPRRPAKRPGAG
jgi:uncharacterized protein